MKLVTTDDAQLRCEHSLRPGAPALLLLNPLGASLEIWDDSFPALSERYEIIRYDKRGHGQSTTGSKTELTMEQLARDALAVLDADWPGLGWVGLARDLPRSCALLVLSDRADAQLLETISALRAEFLSRSASEADFTFRIKTATKLSVPSLRRLAANASKLWNLPRQLSRLLYYNLWSYSDQEIADAMGIPEGTVMSRLFYARKRLQKLLTEEAPVLDPKTSASE